MAEIRHLGCWRQNANSRFSGKLSKLVSCNWTFQRNHYWSPKIQDGWGPLSWKSTSFFYAECGPIWIKFRWLVQNDTSTACGDVEIETSGGRFGKFNGMSSQSHTAGCCLLVNSMSWFQSYVSHCRVLPPGEFNGMSSRATYHIATWWIHCYDSRATCHTAGCSHLAKSMSWSCHIAGCKNSIRHIENRFSPYFIIFLLSMHFRLWRAAAFVSYLIDLFVKFVWVNFHRG